MPKPNPRRTLPPLNWLRAFECAARHMSFTDAAEELGVTQAAVSQQVRQLEDWLGAQLFKRLPRSLALTDAGIAYLPTVRDGFERLAIGTAQVFGHGGRRPVTLRATASLATLWLAPQLARFRRAHPEIAVRVTTLYAPVDFGQDGVDIEIRYGGGSWPGVTADKLFDEAYVPVCSPAWRDANPGPRSPAEIAGRPLIHVLGEREGWGSYFRHYDVAGPPLSQGLQFDTLLVALECCMAGGGIMLATTPLADMLLAEGRLVALGAERIPARLAHYLVVPDTGERIQAVETTASWLLAQR